MRSVGATGNVDGSLRDRALSGAVIERAHKEIAEPARRPEMRHGRLDSESSDGGQRNRFLGRPYSDAGLRSQTSSVGGVTLSPRLAARQPARRRVTSTYSITSSSWETRSSPASSRTSSRVMRSDLQVVSAWPSYPPSPFRLRPPSDRLPYATQLVSLKDQIQPTLWPSSPVPVRPLSVLATQRVIAKGSSATVSRSGAPCRMLRNPSTSLIEQAPAVIKAVWYPLPSSSPRSVCGTRRCLRSPVSAV